MQAYGSVLTGGCGGSPPDLSRPVPRSVPPRAPVRGVAGSMGHVRASDQTRNDAARAARDALREVGKRWRDAREWGVESGRYMPDDCPTHTINPLVVGAYLEWLTAGGAES
jgi:hypothetical protein